MIRSHTLLALAALATVVASGGCDDTDKKTSGVASATAVPSAPKPVASPPPPKDEGVKFTKKFPAKGDKRTASRSMDMTLALNAGGKDNPPMEMGEREVSKHEVLEANGNTITKLLVTYESKFDKEGKKEKKSPLAGKTYTVMAKDGKIEVLDKDGKPAPKAEAEAVSRDHAESVGKPDRLISSVPERGLKPGERISEMEAALRDTFADLGGKKEKKGENEPKIKDVKITFKGAEGDLGLFDVEISLASEDKTMPFTIPLKGTLKLRLKDAWATELTLAGDFKITPTEGQKVAVAGNGTMKVSMTTSY